MKPLAPGRLIRIGLASLGIMSPLVVGRALATDVPAVAVRVQQLGALAPIVFILVCALTGTATSSRHNTRPQ